MARPPKPAPTPAEIALAIQMRQDGRGLASIAKTISQGRGAHLMATEAAANKRTVSSRWVGRLIFGKTETSAKRLNARSVANLRQNANRTGYSGTRMGYSPTGGTENRKETEPLTFAAQKAQAEAPQSVQVDSAGANGATKGA